MRALVGTSGYSYKEWVGGFYPDGTGAADMLSHYGQHLPTVEINNTFYRMPRAEVLERWTQQVPAEFRFALKASRRITHQNRLRGAQDNLQYLHAKLEALGDRLGAVLFQLPPTLRKDLPRLRAFVGELPDGLPAAFEFRHRSWFSDDVYEVLRGRNCALCGADHDPEDDIPSAPLIVTADWGYVRLRRQDYAADDLEDWAGRLREQAPHWRQVFAFLMHEDDAPALAQRLAGLLDR